MTSATSSWAPVRARAPRSRVVASSRSHAVPLLQLFAVLLMAFPSDMVFKPIGAVGFPAGLVGMAMCVVWGVATMLGIHDARRSRSALRGVLCLFWLVTLVSYLLIDRGALTAAQLQSADRFLMEVAVITGVALIAGECLTTLAEVRRVLRALVWGGSFTGLVAALQFWLSIDVTPNLRSLLPGFTHNADNATTIIRGGLSRVTGTAIDPIELGVVAGMLVPLAIYLAIYDSDRKLWQRWVPVFLIGLAVPVSVSRSAILALVLSSTILIVLMPVAQRLVALACIPFALGVVFVTAHGLIGTLAQYFGAGTSDSSIAHRVNNWSYVEQLVHQAPWFGQGGGTFIPTTATSTLHVLDDQYLHTAIELGLVGVLALGALLIVPLFVALAARQRSQDPELRLLCAALAGAGLSAAVCSAAFDSLSFPMFYGVYALVLGLVGAGWRLAADDSSPAVTGGRAGRNGARGPLASDLVPVNARYFDPQGG